MYNYNLVNPINITYRKPQNGQNAQRGEDDTRLEGYNQGQDSGTDSPVSFDGSKNQRQFPNGNKVQIDYTKNKINIAQIVEDFKSTIAAINAPKEVADEVNLYLALVERESLKESPSRDIILSNLKNASKVSDKYIEDSLKKPSKVVEDWVDALFLQRIDLKSNPNDINEAYRVQIPSKTQETSRAAGLEPLGDDVFVQSGADESEIAISQNIFANSNNADIYKASQNVQKTFIPIQGSVDLRYTEAETIEPEIPAAAEFEPSVGSSEFQFTRDNTSRILEKEISQRNIEAQKFSQDIENELRSVEEFSRMADASNQRSIQIEANQVYKIQASNTQNTTTYSTQNKNAEVSGNSANADTSAFILPKEEDKAKSVFVRAKRIVKSKGDPYSALKLYDEALSLVKNSNNENLKAAIYFERGKVFDDYDYVEYALKDYYKATNCKDYNLKAHAHLNMGRIYDDYVMFDPAMEQYTYAIDSSEAANNAYGKTKALRYIASMFADRFDKENTEIFSELAIDSSYETNNPKTIAKTYNDTAKNYEYIGENKKALQNYGNAAKALSQTHDYATLAQNYEEAANLMQKIGNEAKSQSLLSKSRYYHQKAKLTQNV